MLLSGLWAALFCSAFWSGHVGCLSRLRLVLDVSKTVFVAVSLFGFSLPRRLFPRLSHLSRLSHGAEPEME